MRLHGKPPSRRTGAVSAGGIPVLSGPRNRQSRQDLSSSLIYLRVREIDLHVIGRAEMNQLVVACRKSLDPLTTFSFTPFALFQ